MLSRLLKALELKVPPPVVGLLMALGMKLLAAQGPAWALPEPVRTGGALVLVLIGLGLDLAGLLSFRRARTTVHPLKPGNTSTLVCTGVYRLTRNPMYAGMLSMLLGWALYLSTPWALLGPMGFVLFIQRFQIRPEERVLARRFGRAYAEYRSTVRRWL
ncbi:protein-S-isoprenylcysteine O-methyltransferase Ste14 [Sphaerotilus hippei]|uniref:Protein-S-isoprenylcysteine O-methyltransferase Ste14 n=1 Tax=Sphaerotilus hippei TaxID=744406 RepID=A0A318H0E1_9BURK|nr:isoprenylcysteine carboxylmethyltransferase family protein [Sphaerotilus hippei]PXW96269.1 protein-S-isoprenylcysteine O-methyltransferase Ste14 [Sphaerotilus hippei]